MSYVPIRSTKMVDRWLKAYGYASVEEMQQRHGLAADGFAGPLTLDVMDRPRCGVSDARAAADCRWPAGKTDFRYFNSHGGFSLFFREMPKRRSRAPSQAMVDRGLARWGEVTGFRFERARTEDPREIDLWVGGGKGRRFGFDGPGRVLAWAELPCGRFDYLESRFDVQELWTRDPSRRDPWVYAYAVWLHEIGHLLGLDHSDDPGDLMAPYYNPDVTDIRPGDIERIRALYAGR